MISSVRHVKPVASLHGVIAVLLLGSLLLIMPACGGGSSSNPAPSTTQVLVGIGDSPADWIMAFSMMVGSMTLTGTDGSSVRIISSATPLEMMRLPGTVQPLVIESVPQRTYTKATIK